MSKFMEIVFLLPEHGLVEADLYFFSCYLQTGYSSRLMHALSVMARKDGRTGALNYFDLTQPNAVRNYLVICIIHRSTC